MNIAAIKNILDQRYHHLEEVASNVFCATEVYHGKPYAVRYFDLSDDIYSRSEALSRYMENVLGEDYFDVKRPIDLRWSNYLYFITSDEHQTDAAFRRAKSIIESDREYARKFVIPESNLTQLLKLSPQSKDRLDTHIKDLYNTWLNLLNEKQLGYALDFNLSAPRVVRKIGNGEFSKLEQTMPVGQLNAAERDAISHPIKNLDKKGFREYPKDGEFQFGNRVNLITGANGNGKTSLLEAIEYLYCGSTYRNGSASKSTHIAATLVNSSQRLETKSTQSFSKQLKIRNLGWYGKNDLRGSTLSKSFARFNFMDTDAAIRLSVEETPEQLSKDISRIMLGPEAGKASDQINRILIELEKKHTAKGKDNRQVKTKIQLWKQELDSLNEMTKQSDTFFQQLDRHLKTMGWFNQLNSADYMFINTLSENLATANHQCNLLEGINLYELNKQRQKFESVIISLSPLVDSVSNSDMELESLTTQKEKISNKHKIIKELQTYSGSDLLNLEQKQKDQTFIINDLQAKLPDLQLTRLIDGSLADLPLSNALSETDTKLTKVLSEKADVLVRIEEHERTQSTLVNLRDKLISTATNILESSLDKDHCPLCHTQFEEGQLMLHIANETLTDSAPRSDELRSKLITLQTSETDLQKTKALIMALISYCGHSCILVTAHAMIEKDKKKVLEYQETLRKITTKLNNYGERGLTTSRLKEIMRILGITEYTPKDLDVLLQSLDVELIDLTKEINSKKSKLDDTNHKISVLAEKAGLSKSLPTATLSKTIMTEMKQCDQKIVSATHLGSFMELKEDFSVISLSHQISEARDILSKFITTRKQEEEASSRTQQLEQLIKSSQKELTEGKAVMEYQYEARKTLSNLLSGQNSLESIKRELLKNNAAIISEVFSKIHLPNEYDINVEGEEIKLIHKVTKESRSLKEVSTGQRTAFALSLFLTVNKTLGSGPMALLLDDPISHIDDVNMLSFLDYLRELAIDGSRQIFFATPNKKLAGLFRHKFRFLGDKEFKEIHMERQN